MSERILVFVPTYNERENVTVVCEGILAQGLGCDVLFLDDASPDGTGALLDSLAERYPRLTVIHRSRKLGIGSAHQEGIAYAYEHGYSTLVTMDADHTHKPEDIPRLIAASPGYDVVVGSRYLNAGSLPGWNVFRRALTNVGHQLTKKLLGIPGDASGALRLYHIARIRREVFALVRSRSYSFFFESLFMLAQNGYRIREIPIVLPARTYGHSKLSLREAWRSAMFLLSLSLQSFAEPARFRIPRSSAELHSEIVDPQDWDSYWATGSRTGGMVYGLIATLYRKLIIRPNLHRSLLKHFEPGSSLLHAGCGSGQVDGGIHDTMRVTAVDISGEALHVYARNNPDVFQLKHASVFALPMDDGAFDGVYNLGVVEHFSREEIGAMLREFHRVLRPKGKVLLFWPHKWATSVFALGFAHFILNTVLRRKVRLHPEEISLLRSKNEALRTLEQAGFVPVDYYFGPRDLFVQAVVVGQKPTAAR